MQIRTETHEGTLIAYVAGRIDGANASDFKRTMEALIGEEKTVVVDCGQLSEITSAGLSAFLMISRILEDQSKRFALCCLAPRLKGIFAMTGFDKIISVHATQAKALDLIQD